MRWRTIEEVKAGKGQKICANVVCARGEALEEMEVAFGYTEDGKRKNVLVKCVLCKKCAGKLRKARGTEEQPRKRKRSHHRHHERSENHPQAAKENEETRSTNRGHRHHSREHESAQWR
jgi:hypothetical protein